MRFILPALLACLAANAVQPTKPASTPASPAAAQPAKQPLPAGHPGVVANDPTLNWPKPRPEDVSSIDAIVGALYSVPAGNPGQPRDWDRYRSLFSPDAA